MLLHLNNNLITNLESMKDMAKTRSAKTKLAMKIIVSMMACIPVPMREEIQYLKLNY
jgi:hypothetical protein